MNLLIYLAGMVTFLFAFFFFADHTSEHSSFVYLQYASLLIAFYIIGLAFVHYIDSKPKKISKTEAMNTRRDTWFAQRKDRRSKRRFK